ncbi:unnamed protein product [Prunus armeniaca]
MEDVSLSEAWLQVCHYPVSGNEMKFFHIRKKIHAEFCEKISKSTCTEMALSSRWKILNKELAKWRDALAKAMDNHRSRENLSNEMIQAQMWFGAIGQGQKIIILTGPTVMLNETPLRDSMTSDSPLDSPMSQDSPIKKGLRGCEGKERGNSSSNTSKNLAK